MQHHSRTEQHPQCAWNSKHLHYECKYPYILSLVLQFIFTGKYFLPFTHTYTYMYILAWYQVIRTLEKSQILLGCTLIWEEFSFHKLKNKGKLKIKLLESLKCRTNSPASWKLQIIHVQYSYLNIYHESDFFSTCISKMLKLFLIIYFWYMYMINVTLLDWLTS